MTHTAAAATTTTHSSSPSSSAIIQSRVCRPRSAATASNHTSTQRPADATNSSPQFPNEHGSRFIGTGVRRRTTARTWQRVLMLRLIMLFLLLLVLVAVLVLTESAPELLLLLQLLLLLVLLLSLTSTHQQHGLLDAIATGSRGARRVLM